MSRPFKPRRPGDFDEMKFPLGFKLWAAFVALLALGFTGVVVWAIIKLVTKVTS